MTYSIVFSFCLNLLMVHSGCSSIPVWWGGVVGLREGARTCGYAYRAVHVCVCVCMCKGAWTCGYRAVHVCVCVCVCEGASSRCKVHRGHYVGTSSMFLDLISCISFTSSFGIFVTFASYQFRFARDA